MGEMASAVEMGVPKAGAVAKAVAQAEKAESLEVATEEEEILVLEAKEAEPVVAKVARRRLPR